MENDSEKTNSNRHEFSTDKPIASTDEDLLGRAPFAESLASAIKGWRGNDSLVVALYGPWGSGKSSVKNMSLETLRSDKENCPLIIEFNPWQWSGQDQLVEAFFREIGLILDRSDASEHGKRRAAKWRTYGTYLTLGASVAKSLKAILPLLGLPGSGIADILVKGMEQSAALAQEGSKGVEDQELAQDRTLSEIKKELSDSLKALDRPILVVLDDIDRLTSEEIRLLFQLVKANADFPNVVYLLLFQRDIVAGSLDSPPVSGNEFLEKIVQVGFNIPSIERTRLEKVLFARFEELLTDADVSKHFDHKRWGNLFFGGIRPYFETLRDVYRYLATLSFHISLFRSTGSFEVNPIDLIALEVLRVFEPAAYQRLSEAKLELTSQRDHAHDSHDQNERTRKLIQSIIEPASQPGQVREVLRQLFPPVGWVFGDPTYGPHFSEGWSRDLRLCHPEVFDRYFHFAIPEGDISQAEIDRVLSLVSDREGLASKFRVLAKRDLLSVTLDRLEAYKQSIDLQYAVPFVTGLFDIGDELPEERRGFFSISSEMHVSRIIYWYLKQETNRERRGEILKQAMKTTTGLYLPVMMTSLESNEEKRKSDPEAFVTDADLKELQQLCIVKIKHAVKTGDLAKHSKMLPILYRWREWDSPKKPREWVQDLVQSRECGALVFLTACLHRSTSQGIGDYVSREHWRINLKTVEDFVSVDTLEEKVARLSLENLNEKETKSVKAFRHAIKRRMEGKSEDDWRDNGNE